MMKITYEIEFDITFRDGASFPEPEFARILKEAVESGVRGAFSKAMCKLDDELENTDKMSIDDVSLWGVETTEIAK
jgi:hypothetical protein